MSNWAALQEDMIQLPVFKRAKHGIHFKNNDGSITANFSGKPCHFQDTDGLWKPIDTKLLPLGDGYYGCPHSKVKVHPDGHVAVAGTDYIQRVTLPSAQAGLLDGDKLVRKFSFGEQRMWVTETGFKSEIQLNRIPTLTEARKLIASESGTLSKKYLKSLTTATDANGDIHTYSTLAAFRTWLASAKMPVVIDPDFSSQPDETASMDTYIAGYSGFVNRNYGISTLIKSDEVSGDIQRAIIKFDLSSIPTGATVSAGSLVINLIGTPSGTKTINFHRSLVQWYEGNKNGAALDASVDGSTWNYRNNNGSVAWAGGAGGAAGSDWATDATDSETVNVGSATTLDITADCAYWVANPSNNYGGWLLRVETTIYTEFASSGYATESSRPVLTVTYTAGASGNPHYYYAQQ